MSAVPRKQRKIRSLASVAKGHGGSRREPLQRPAMMVARCYRSIGWAALAFERGPPAKALDVHLQNGGVVHDPPFAIREAAAGWLADGIAPAHCLAVVDRHLQAHAASCRSGSGDRLLPYLDKQIRFENGAPHPQLQRQELKRPEEPRPGSSLDEYTNRSRTKRIAEADWLGDY